MIVGIVTVGRKVNCTYNRVYRCFVMPSEIGERRLSSLRALEKFIMDMAHR